MKLLLFVVSVFTVLLAADPASAHGGHEPLETGIPSFVVIAVHAILMATAVVVARTGRLDKLRLLGAGTTRLTNVRTFGTFGQLLTGAMLAVALWVDDPFGTVGRVAFLLIVGGLLLPLLGAWWWRGWPGNTHPVSPALSAFCLFVPLWFFLVYPDPTRSVALAALLAFSVASAAAAMHRLDNPLGDAFARLCGGERSSPLVTSTALGAICFAILREHASWNASMAQAPFWGSTLSRTLTLAVCVATVFAVIHGFAAAISWLNHSERRTVLHALASGLAWINIGLACAVFLPSLVQALQDLLAVLWDPFGKGWTLSPDQGIWWQPSTAWIDRIRMLVLGLVSAAAVTQVPRSKDVVPVSAALMAAGFAGLYFVLL